jgi:hypothetical protein
MEEIKNEYPKNSERFIRKVEWCTDDTIFLGAIMLAGFTTVLCFIL